MGMNKIPDNYDLRKILEELIDRLERGQIISNGRMIIERGNPNEE